MAREIESTINLFPLPPSNLSNVDRSFITESGYSHIIVLASRVFLHTITFTVFHVYRARGFNRSRLPSVVGPSLEKKKKRERLISVGLTWFSES